MVALLTNAHIYRAIAEEAFAESTRLEQDAKTPKPDGSPGFVIKLDPERKSFKQSLIAVAFAGVYLEALLYLKGTQRLGSRWANEFDRKPYEHKLKALGITDIGLIQSAERLRKVRNDLVHEKCASIDQVALSNTHWAEVEASEALKFIRAVAEALEERAH